MNLSSIKLFPVRVSDAPVEEVDAAAADDIASWVCDGRRDSQIQAVFMPDVAHCMRLYHEREFTRMRPSES